jgi:hypothetical protein
MFSGILDRRRGMGQHRRKQRRPVLIGIIVLAVLFAVVRVITRNQPIVSPAPIAAPWTTETTTELSCVGGSGDSKGTLDLDVMPGQMLAVRGALNVTAHDSSDATETLPAGSYSAHEDGQGHILADISTYRADKAGSGRHRLDFTLSLTKKTGHVNIALKDGGGFSGDCVPRLFPVAQSTPGLSNPGLPPGFICVMSLPGNVRTCARQVPIPGPLSSTLRPNDACVEDFPGQAPTCGARVN